MWIFAAVGVVRLEAAKIKTLEEIREEKQHQPQPTPQPQQGDGLLQLNREPVKSPTSFHLKTVLEESVKTGSTTTVSGNNPQSGAQFPPKGAMSVMQVNSSIFSKSHSATSIFSPTYQSNSAAEGTVSSLQTKFKAQEVEPASKTVSETVDSNKSTPPSVVPQANVSSAAPVQRKQNSQSPKKVNTRD